MRCPVLKVTMLERNPAKFVILLEKARATGDEGFDLMHPGTSIRAVVVY